MMNTYDNNWNMGVPPSALKKSEMWLLTTMGLAVKGIWEGRDGEFFVGWSESSPCKEIGSGSVSKVPVISRKPTHDACTVQQ